jgi:hypothetical protein
VSARPNALSWANSGTVKIVPAVISDAVRALLNHQRRTSPCARIVR